MEVSHGHICFYKVLWALKIRWCKDYSMFLVWGNISHFLHNLENDRMTWEYICIQWSKFWIQYSATITIWHILACTFPVLLLNTLSFQRGCFFLKCWLTEFPVLWWTEKIQIHTVPSFVNSLLRLQFVTAPDWKKKNKKKKKTGYF